MSFMSHAARGALLGFAALALPVSAQNSAGPSLAVFGVPLGGTAADVERMVGQRGFGGFTDHCQAARICRYRVNIENLQGTEFFSTSWGFRRLADRTEAFSFAFTAPPNEHRIWSAGSDQSFGDWFNVSASAPILPDVLAELRKRFGEPVRTQGLEARRANAGNHGQLWWLWDAEGRPVRWTRETHQTCYLAMGKASVETGLTLHVNSNAAPVDPQPFLRARQGNCAYAVRADIGHTRGLVYSLSIRAVDFKAGHDAQYRTNQLLREKRGEGDSARSNRNRPDF
ncbi:hypothetical protein ACIPPQ_03120 [Sphingopyxis sp. LARHCG72]